MGTSAASAAGCMGSAGLGLLRTAAGWPAGGSGSLRLLPVRLLLIVRMGHGWLCTAAGCAAGMVCVALLVLPASLWARLVST